MPLQFTAFGIVPSAVTSVRTMSARKVVTVRDTPACANPQGGSRHRLFQVGRAVRADDDEQLFSSADFWPVRFNHPDRAINTGPDGIRCWATTAATVRWIQARRSIPRPANSECAMSIVPASFSKSAAAPQRGPRTRGPSSPAFHAHSGPAVARMKLQSMPGGVGTYRGFETTTSYGR